MRTTIIPSRSFISIWSLSSLTALGLMLGGCAKPDSSCDALATRLCDGTAEHCAAARSWVDARGAGDAAARDEACAQMLADPAALTAYARRFKDESATTPRTTAPAQPAGAPRPATTTPKPTTKDEIRTFGDNVEEIGTVGEKVGEAFDKLEKAFDRKDTNP